jgi:hypothetical protein
MKQGIVRAGRKNKIVNILIRKIGKRRYQNKMIKEYKYLSAKEGDHETYQEFLNKVTEFVEYGWEVKHFFDSGSVVLERNKKR